jgi:hypothetical protein
MDIKPDDRPWISILTKKGNYVYYQLVVIDRITGLYSFRGKHVNDTRYPEFQRSKSSQKNLEYTRPFMVIEKTYPSNLMEDYLHNNASISFT